MRTVQAKPELAGKVGARHQALGHWLAGIPGWRATGQLFPFLVSLVIVLGTWELLVTTRVIDPRMVPPPSEIGSQFATRILTIITGGGTWTHFSTTLTQVLIGFCISLIIGIGLGTLMSESSLARRALYPYIIGFNATPRIAFAPIFIIWFGFGIWPRVAMVIALATFPTIVSTMAGLRASDPDSMKLMRALGATGLETFLKVRVPYALPHLFAGIELAIVLSVIGSIVSEFVAGNRGLGYLLIVDQESLRAADMFAVILLISMLAMVLHQLVLLVRGRFVFWHGR